MSNLGAKTRGSASSRPCDRQKILHWPRSPKKKALVDATAILCEKMSLFLGLNPLRNHGQPQVLPQSDDGAGKDRIIGIGEHIAHKRPINFQLVQGQTLQTSERRKANAKVVKRETHAASFQSRHLGARLFYRTKHYALRKFQHQLSRVGADLINDGQHARDKFGMAKLASAYVDRHCEVRSLGPEAPRHQLPARSFDDPLTDWLNQSIPFRKNDKFRRR